MKLTKERVSKALTATGAVIADTAAMLNVSQSAVYQYLKRHPDMQQLRTEIEDELLDYAEAHMVEAVKRGDLDACMYLLERKGKNRGYSSRVEIVRAE